MPDVGEPLPVFPAARSTAAITALVSILSVLVLASFIALSKTDLAALLSSMVIAASSAILNWRFASSSASLAVCAFCSFRIWACALHSVFCRAINFSPPMACASCDIPASCALVIVSSPGFCLKTC